MQQRELPRVRTEPASVRAMARSFEVSTKVLSESEVTIYPRTAGVVVKVLAEEGDEVRTGQALAELDLRDAQNALRDSELALVEAEAQAPVLELAAQEALAQLDSARRSYEQAERDHERNVAIAAGVENRPGLISQKDLDASQLTRDMARAEFETAELAHRRALLDALNGGNAVERARLARDQAILALSYLTVEAPFDGVLAVRSIRVGDTVSSATPAFVLTDPAKLRAIVQRPQRELPLFRPALFASNGSDGAAPLPIEITAEAEALPGLVFRGEIERISPTIDAESGNFRVTVRFDGQAENAPPGSAELLPGMLVRLEIVTDRHAQALCVPKRALQRQGDESVVFALREGHAARIPVLELYTDDEFVEVAPAPGAGEALAFLAPGEPVIVVGQRDLEDGAPVEAVAQDAAAEDEPSPGDAAAAAQAESGAPADEPAADEPREDRTAGAGAERS